MKAKHLIKLLQQVDPEEEINLEDDQGGIDPVMSLRAIETRYGDNWMTHRYVLAQHESCDAVQVPTEKRVCYIHTWEGYQDWELEPGLLASRARMDERVFTGEGWFEPTADGAASYPWLLNNAIVWEEERVFPNEEWKVS